MQSAGIKAQTRTNLGATMIAHAALLNGEIDLYPEYTGTALAHVVKGDLSGSADQIYQTVKSYYEKNLHLTLLAPTHMSITATPLSCCPRPRRGIASRR